MKKKKNKLVIGASIAILAMFLMSIVWPATQQIAKLISIVIFAIACFAPLHKEQREGKDITAYVIFYICVIGFLAYLLFF